MTKHTHRWMQVVLWAAAIYNLLFGAIAVLFPSLLFRWAEMPIPNYPELWQCLGMVIGVYGIGYAIAATDPRRHWAIVFVGLVGKFLGPIGFLRAALLGRLPWKAGWMNVANDLVWWIPFALILIDALKHRTEESS